jgi:hypothetical protein
MRTNNRGTLPVCLLTFLLISCSGTDRAPRVGTPEFAWAAARENYAAGDYIKVVEHLGRIVQTGHPLAAQAEPWRLLLLAGMADNYTMLADRCELGARASQANRTLLRKKLSDYRALADRTSLQFAEAYSAFHERNKDPEIILAFPYPSGSSMVIDEIEKVALGTPFKEAQAQGLENRNLQRSLLLATCNAVGAPEDVAKTSQLFQGGDVKVPRGTFMLAMAKALNDRGSLYAREKVDKPQFLEMMNKLALEAVKEAPEGPDRKKLQAKIETALKAAQKAQKKS